MTCKAKSKPASNVLTPFEPCAATKCFLAAMNQNHCIMSCYTINELKSIVQTDWETVVQDLLSMNFSIHRTDNNNNNAPIEVDSGGNFEEMTLAEDLTNSIAAFGQWFKNNNIPDDHCSDLISNIRHIAMMFNLIPAPHCCPIPPPCTHLHQDDGPPCRHLHTDDILTPPPCTCPHCNKEDTPMEPPAPTCAFSEAALQTPAPNHEASTPPPPPTAAATLPAAAASTPPASPCGCTSYAGITADMVNSRETSTGTTNI
ncbi:hypothetical protein P691DRAFT_769599, partial [Macrolepiota fuliginosa MF-IS2]